MKKDMTYELQNEKIGKLLFKLAVPSVLAQLVSLLYTVIDRVYIGHIKDIGSTALTGIGLCMPIIVIINAFINLIAQGGAPLSSIAMGRDDKEGAEKILGNCTSSLAIIGIVLTMVFLFFGKSLLMLFGASGNTISYAHSYMMIYVSGSIFVMFALGLNQFIIAQGFTKFSMISVCLGAITNIILDPIFIFVFDLGVKGAAIATVISQLLSCIFVVYFLNSKRSILHIKKKYFKLDYKIMIPVMSLGLAPFIMQATEAALNLSFNYSLQKYGGDIAVGAMTIASTVLQMFWIPCNGIGQGAQPIISNNYGAGNVERVKKTVKLLFIVMEVYMMTCWSITMAFPEIFIRMFSNSNGALFNTSRWALRVYIGSMGLFGLQSATQQVFVSTGQAKASIFIASLRKVILLIPFIFILPIFMSNKVLAVFLAEPVSDIISVTAAFTIFRIKFPEMMNNLGDRN